MPIRESAILDAGSLASGSVAILAGPAMAHDVFITRSDIHTFIYSLAATENGLLFGIADKDLDATDIEKCLEANGPLHPRDHDRDEQARRRVTVIGFAGAASSDDSVSQDQGNFTRFVHRRLYTEDSSGWNWWVYNVAGQTLDATFNVAIVATHHARWSA